MFVSRLLTIICVSFLQWQCMPVAARPSEAERVQLWKEKNTWPPQWQPETQKMKALLKEREKEIMQLTNRAERWENWLQLVQQRLVPKFTQNGFLLAKTPADIHEKLSRITDAAIQNQDNIRSEGSIRVIYHPEESGPKFIDVGPELHNIHNTMTALHEDWIGGNIKLRPTSIYGIRVYQNGSSLVMHYDKVQTHVISSIVHIGHEYDNNSEPWPIEIEDHDGNLHAVNLEPGQMLFYESAKCLHGRRSLLRGKYYAGVFLHYQPVDPAVWNYDVEAVIAAVPPHWGDRTTPSPGSVSVTGITVPSRAAVGSPNFPKEAKIQRNIEPRAIDEL